MTDKFWLIQVEKVSKNDIKNTEQNNIYVYMYIYTYTKEKVYIKFYVVSIHSQGKACPIIHAPPLQSMHTLVCYKIANDSLVCSHTITSLYGLLHLVESMSAKRCTVNCASSASSARRSTNTTKGGKGCMPCLCCMRILTSRH